MEEIKRRFNIIDLVIILVIILVGAAIASKLIYPDFFVTKPDTVSVMCTFSAYDDVSPYASGIKVGDTVYVNTDVQLGTVTEVAVEKVQDGETEKNRYSFTVNAKVSVINDGFSLDDGTVIAVGKEFDINTKSTVCRVFTEKTIKTAASD